ncbi:acid protease [Glonium stellatum]|uniref:Acid protease n=1 Tax=Glonium stellatum TaxID=574774 RepID=A0A8E2JXI1_9PEZI|nr:acid protease [Glonium stellatum]
MSLTNRAEATRILLPYIFPPSGSFEGNDGAWSTFTVNIGDSGNGISGQDFRVLISTSGSATLIPVQTSWCNVPDQLTCANSRGVQPYHSIRSPGFQSDKSSNWQQEGLYNLEIPNYVPNTHSNATYGRDTVGIGPDSANSSILRRQLVAELITDDFFMGSFGLSTLPTSFGTEIVESFLTVFNQSNCTPSLSYSYTAGAIYRNEGVLGNLVFGGYDQSRFTSGVQIPMPSTINSSLIVGVESIIINRDEDFNPAVFSSTTEGFLALIDSTFPYLWLPQSVCDSLASIFQLTYDLNTSLYTVNDTSHAYNLKQNANITFKIGNTASSSDDFTDIVLPYAAFDLQASYPIYNNATRYFPIKRSSPGYYVLGRTFLQEAYLVVDYERNNFTVAPANFSDPMPNPHVVTIHSVKYSPPQPKHPGLSIAIIVGVAVGATIFVAISLVTFLLWRRHRKQHEKEKVLDINSTATDSDGKPDLPIELPTPNSPQLHDFGQGYSSSQIKHVELGSPDAHELDTSLSSDTSPRRDERYRGSAVGSDMERWGETPVNSHPCELPGDYGIPQILGQHIEQVVRRSDTASPQRNPRTNDFFIHGQ